MNLDSVTIPKERIIEKYVGAKFNTDVLVPYLLQYNADLGGDITIQNLTERVKDCCNLWLLDYYRLSRMAEVKQINFCKCKFCPTCQKIFANNRELKLTPIVSKALENYDLLHMVLTNENVKGLELKSFLNHMMSCYYYLVRYLDGRKKIKGIDFSKYGYVGSLRNLEITFNSGIDDYHPHFHCILAVKKGLEMPRLHINKYSFKKDENGQYTILYAKFSNLEILIQKIWYLLINKIKVTKNAIDSLMIGYNCMIDPIEEQNYHEVFKYSLKISYDSLSYENFTVLYDALYKRRTIQGYGIFFNLHIDDTLSEEEVFAYYEIIARVRELEDPLSLNVQFDYLLNEMLSQKIQFVTRKKILLERDNLVSDVEKLSPYGEKVKQALIKQYRNRKLIKSRAKEARERRKKAMTMVKQKIGFRKHPSVDAYWDVIYSGFYMPYDIFEKEYTREVNLIIAEYNRQRLAGIEHPKVSIKELLGLTQPNKDSDADADNYKPIYEYDIVNV